MVRRALVAASLSAALLFTAVPAVSAAPADTSRGNVAASSYRGKYYSPRWERARRCIVWRESRGQYRVVNRSSGAAGAYQFMRRTSNEMARRMGKPWLIGVPASRWSRADQDRAFWMLWNHGKGRSHWYSRSKPCW